MFWKRRPGKKLIDNYNKAKEELYKHFNFKEDWVIYPIDDSTRYWWKLTKYTVIFAETLEQLLDEDSEDYYQNEIYTQRFYSKHVYEGKDLTLVFVDTHTDGMKYFQIFDNKKRVYGKEKET